MAEKDDVQYAEYADSLLSEGHQRSGGVLPLVGISREISTYLSVIELRKYAINRDPNNSEHQKEIEKAEVMLQKLKEAHKIVVDQLLANPNNLLSPEHMDLPLVEGIRLEIQACIDAIKSQQDFLVQHRGDEQAIRTIEKMEQNKLQLQLVLKELLAKNNSQS